MDIDGVINTKISDSSCLLRFSFSEKEDRLD